MAFRVLGWGRERGVNGQWTWASTRFIFGGVQPTLKLSLLGKSVWIGDSRPINGFHKSWPRESTRLGMSLSPIPCQYYFVQFRPVALLNSRQGSNSRTIDSLASRLLWRSVSFNMDAGLLLRQNNVYACHILSNVRIFFSLLSHRIQRISCNIYPQKLQFLIYDLLSITE